MNGADTAWIGIATALVLFMTLPGLALFYAGLVRARNVLSVFLHCYLIACLMSLLWFFVGYSIAFGDANPYWGGLEKVALIGVTSNDLTGTIPEVLFFAFQMTFAIIAPALIVGAYVERVSLGFVVLFSSLWMLTVYAPVTHWVWGGGFLSDGGIFGAVGVKDYAGGIVVHETAGLAALVIAVILGPRRLKDALPHNPGLTMIGASMLWVGWFGFNGGSTLAANGEMALAITVTHISAATASLTWVVWERIKYGRISLVGVVTGTIAGLACITPASGLVGPMGAIATGAVGGIVCQEAAVLIRTRLGIDDSLDVFAVHGVGGAFGTIMVAALGAASFQAQVGGILIVGAYTIVITAILAFFCKGVLGIRVDAEAESLGLDIAVQREKAYDWSS